MRLILAALGAAALGSSAAVSDDTPTPAERASVMQAILAIGCDNPTKIERDDGGFEVDNARCQDGVFDLKLSADFRILSRDRDD